ncbi:MAG: hypothetical protein AAGA56_07305 [Myxococcota bacterium]
MASDLNDPDEVAEESSQVFGSPVAHLREAAVVVAGERGLLPVPVQQCPPLRSRVAPGSEVEGPLLDHLYELDFDRLGGVAPNFAEMVVVSLSDPDVIRSTLRFTAAESASTPRVDHEAV